MSIRMEKLGGLSCPVVRCDVCALLIEDGAANVLWRVDADWGNVIEGPLFVHKGACDRRIDPPDHRQRRRYLWSELRSWLDQLVGNAGVQLPWHERGSA